MKTVVLLYPTSCIYEIVILNYFLHFAGKEVLFVSPDGTPITAMEGYSINVSGKLTDIAPDEIELAIVPGGNIKAIDNPIVWNCLKDIKSRGGILAAICAGVDVLDHAGILDGVRRCGYRSGHHLPGEWIYRFCNRSCKKDEFISG